MAIAVTTTAGRRKACRAGPTTRFFPISNGRDLGGWRDALSRRRRPDLCPRLKHRSLYDAIEAGTRAGHPFTDDYNGEQQHGFGWAQWTIRNGRRDSTARAYLHPALGRRNLAVYTGALARRVVLEGGRAVGVDFRRHGAEQTVRATREVILSAGSINTPQLMMLSGIGDPDHLREFAIEASVASPGVGRNLQDHYSSGLFLLTANRGHSLQPLALIAWRSTSPGPSGRTGPVTDVPSGFMAFVKTDRAWPCPTSVLSGRSVECRPLVSDHQPAGATPCVSSILLRPASRE